MKLHPSDEHEARIDEAQKRMEQAKTLHERFHFGGQFLLAVMTRNAERTAADVERLERERGLR